MRIVSIQPILGIFAKWPRAGRVKTRLAKLRDPEWAAQVAQAFLLDTLDRCAALPVRKVVVYASQEGQDDFAQYIPPGYELTPQGDGDLGQRLDRFFAHAQGPAIVLGTDSPTLPLDYLEQAFNLLQSKNVVLGPATDGGYYLLGMSQYCPELLRDIPWSTAQVLETTVSRAVETRRSLALLPPWYDVDTPADWELLRGHMNAMKAAGMEPGAPRTEKMLTREETSIILRMQVQRP